MVSLNIPSEKERYESRIPELDGIRGVAILMVVSFHYFLIPESHTPWVKAAGAMLGFGWSGVDLFFVLSGFLLGGILIDNFQSQNYFRTFYTRRVCRIFPLYYLWLALFYLLPFLFTPGFLDSTSNGFFYLKKWGDIFFLQNFYRTGLDGFDALWMGVTWSLAVEEQFYLLVPVLLRFALPRKPIFVLVALILMVPLARIFLFLFYPSVFIHVLLPCRADTLLIGVLCAYLIRQKPVRDWLASNVKTLYAAAFCLGLFVAYLISLGYGFGFMKVLTSFEMTSYGFSVLALFFAVLLMLATVDRTTIVARFLRNPLLRHFGRIAYGIYLIHSVIRALILTWVFGATSPATGILAQNIVSLGAFLLTWLVALLSWRFFEGPIVRWGHSFRYRPEKEIPEELILQNAP